MKAPPNKTKFAQPFNILPENQKRWDKLSHHRFDQIKEIIAFLIRQILQISWSYEYLIVGRAEPHDPAYSFSATYGHTLCAN